MKISVIVPCFNAKDKINDCISSLENQTLSKKSFEVIFVDDCSSDGTFEYLKSTCGNTHNFKFYKLNKNSGSPSRPRNFGLSKAKGEYVFYLDSDDALFHDTLEKYLEFAEKNNMDLVRGYLIVDDGKSKREFNRLRDDVNALGKTNIVSNIVKYQSTTVCQLIRRSILLKNKINWLEHIKMGEDTLFLLKVMSFSENIGYLDHPTFIYNKRDNNNSSTQKYGKRELHNHLFVWSEAEKLAKINNISFYQLRLQVGLKSAIESMINYYQYDFDLSDFGEFSKFLNEVYGFLNIGAFTKKFQDIIVSIKNMDFEGFLDIIKPKLLICGYDLKFIKPALPFLEKYYVVNVDEWSGHESHNVEKSQEFLKWADIIWCEWLLGNAVWYSKNKLPHQKLFIRLHRFELTTKYINLVDYSKVNLIFAVSVYFFEKAIEKLGVSRSKVRVLSNYLVCDDYLKSEDSSKIFNIGMIGILPSKKGFYKSLQLIKDLKVVDSRYKLHIYGKQPKDIPWIVKDKVEMDYYEKCYNFIKDNQLDNDVVFHGWCDIPKSIKNIGYMLSLSENDELFESFHLAPAEAFAAKNIGLFLPWRGVEYIYPKEYILNSLTDIFQYINETNKDYIKFQALADIGCAFVKANYDISIFVEKVFKYLQKEAV
ncbi:glycosyltransferase [Acinetobacter thermotolerans]|uniref:glycosyltransferase n=1 Tax=Acinetobacter thermotolerans TaxID=3151487 RepID=UPI00325B4B0A